ncbi:MAG: nucleotidyltransferase domain-containing protein [Ignavibacteriaceae bacterium]|nr:nucleotidyltransferase domain-containing protein [Ignavibacteriaceae bacterium]
MYSRENITKIINHFVQLVSAEFPIDSVYLFGSYANGNPGEYSDIDIAIVSPKFEGDRFNDIKKLARYIIKSSNDLEIHPIKSEDFTEDNPFANEIIKTGVKIEVRN